LASVEERVRGVVEEREQWHTVNGLGTFSRAAGEGTPVVLIHGVGVSSAYWRPTLPRLAEAGPFAVHAPDLPGFGRSQDPPWPPRLTHLRDHLCAWLDQVVPGPCHLVGQSIGCELAVLTAVARPEQVRKIVLAGPAGLPSLRSIAVQLVRAALDAPHEPLSLYPILARDYWRCGVVRFAQLMAEQKGKLTDEQLRQVRQPALVLRGEKDTVATPKRVSALARVLPNAAVGTVPGAHAAHFAHPEAFAQAVAAFLE
jgi:2-hydroxy-6-oxonona-2,4-dienedioate hydrolase